MSTRDLTYVKAFNEGMHQIMAEDPDVFLIGEDVAGYGGVFHMFDGLLTEFGEARVKDTPIAEQGIIGLGVGAAACGLRPVCDLMFMDFVGVAMDQIFNQAAKMKYDNRRERTGRSVSRGTAQCNAPRNALAMKPYAIPLV